MLRAVKPFVRDAKQDFREEAVPRVVLMKVMFRDSRKWDERRDSWGPERGMEGRVHDEFVDDGEDEDADSAVGLDCEEEDLSGDLSLSLDLEGGGPMIPPSMSLMVIGGGGV